MIRMSIALLGIALCFLVPAWQTKWAALPSKLQICLLGAFVMFAIILTVISSSNTEASFVYVSF